MQLSHSRVECFNQCPFKYKLRYKRKLNTLPKGDPDDPLILGHALHTGIEKITEAAIDEYYNAYPIITDRHVEEAMKLEYWLPKIKDILPEGYHEIKIEDEDYLGFIDLLIPVELPFEDEFEYYNLIDFKYSNNKDNYMDSEQLHLYKYYFEKQYPDKKILSLQFMFVPKCNLKIKYKNKTNKRDETLREFRQRIIEDLNNKKIEFVPIEYNQQKVVDFLTNGKHAIECDDYIKCPSRLCDWCEYKRYCESEGKDDLDMVLPSTQRRTIEKNSYKKIWIYGLPFSGKTYLANEFDTPLMLNTDGNFKQVDAPVIRIVDEVKTEGRITKRKYAWEVFQETVDELEKKNNDFETIIVDLVEDVYDACRIKVCIDNGWDHESDDSFKAYDIVRSEFLRTLKRLLNLDYNIVLISHEDTSRDIMKKSGDKITAIKPNLQEKLALKVAGMVDICCRIINNEGKRTISFKANEVEFGGGRLNIKAKEIPCKYEELMKVYGEDKNDSKREKVSETTNRGNESVVSEPVQPVVSEVGGGNESSRTEGVNVGVETATAEPESTETPERKTRTRKPREVVEEAKEEAAEVVETANAIMDSMGDATSEEAPKRRRRRVTE